MTSESTETSPLLREFSSFVETAVLDPLGTGLSMADFFSGGSDESETYPEAHLFQNYVGWVAASWASDLLDAARDDREARNSLDALAAALGVFGLDEADDEEQDPSEFEWEFLAAMADSLSESVTPQLMMSSSVIGDFNLHVVRWLGGGDRTNADIRPPITADENFPAGVPGWAEQLIRARAGGRCSRCRRQLSEAGRLDYRVGLGLGGARDVSNLEWVCERCVGARPDEQTVRTEG